jgi:hypothetical protein
MRAVARKQKKSLADASVTGHVSFNVADEGKYVLSVELHGKVEGWSSDDTRGADACRARSVPILQRDPREHRGEARCRMKEPWSRVGRAPRALPAERTRMQ